MTRPAAAPSSSTSSGAAGAILGSPDYVSSLITGGLLVIVTIVWAPDLSHWFSTTRRTRSAERASA